MKAIEQSFPAVLSAFQNFKIHVLVYNLHTLRNKRIHGFHGCFPNNKTVALWATPVHQI